MTRRRRLSLLLSDVYSLYIVYSVYSVQTAYIRKFLLRDLQVTRPIVPGGSLLMRPDSQTFLYHKPVLLQATDTRLQYYKLAFTTLHTWTTDYYPEPVVKSIIR